MINKRMQDAFNGQINAEIYSSYLYLSMVAWFEAENLQGFAAWMRAQTQEEMFHTMKLFKNITDRGGRVLLSAIDTPPTEWSSPLDVFETALKHEIMVSGLINDLMELAIEGKDHASKILLNWFVEEQIEEEMNVGENVQKLKLAGNAPNALLMLNAELGTRVFTMPVPGVL